MFVLEPSWSCSEGFSWFHLSEEACEGGRSPSGSRRVKMSLKRRLVSMLLCCVYCVASLFCLHPNRNSSFSAGSRNLVSVVQQLYQRVIRMLRTTL